MRFLDLDLDFFLNNNTYDTGVDGVRPGAEFRPWSAPKVRRFLEERCRLSPDNPVPGRTVASHDGVIEFWRALIRSGKLSIPFEVIHIDAHPDMSVRGGLYLASGLLQIDPERAPPGLAPEDVHAGNYLAFAIACGWVASLVWIPLHKTLQDLPRRYGDARYGLTQLKARQGGGSSAAAGRSGIPFRISSWYRFKTGDAFDYMVLSRSLNFTPPASDALVPVIERYMRQI
jgi:hypothetical protein